MIPPGTLVRLSFADDNPVVASSPRGNGWGPDPTVASGEEWIVVAAGPAGRPSVRVADPDAIGTERHRSCMVANCYFVMVSPLELLAREAE